MNVEVHLTSQSQPIKYSNVINTYTKDGLYCLLLDTNKVHKFPVSTVFRFIEDYVEPAKKQLVKS
jgi:hypothetical protein